MQKLLLPLILAAYSHIPAFAQTPALAASNAQLAPLAGSERMVESTGPLTLAMALELALNANPIIAAATREVEAVDGALRQASSIPNPEFSASVEDTQKATRTTTLQLNQPIELGGKRVARMTVAERNRDTAVVELAIKRADIRAATVNAFHDVLVVQERSRLALASVELAQQASSAANKRVIAGKISPVDETKARIAESSMRIELAQATSELVNARKRLVAMWGNTMPRFERADGQIDTLPSLPTMPDLVQHLQQSPNLNRAKLEVDRRKALTQVERARQIPNITVSVGAKRDEQLGRNQAILGITIPLPLFDHNQGNLQEALSRTDKARNELMADEVRLSGELAQAHERLHAAREEAQLLRQDILPGAQSAYDAAIKGFEYGKFNFLDVLDAQRTLLQAKSQSLRALSEAHRAATEIGRILGDALSSAFVMPVVTTP